MLGRATALQRSGASCCKYLAAVTWHNARKVASSRCADRVNGPSLSLCAREKQLLCFSPDLLLLGHKPQTETRSPSVCFHSMQLHSPLANRNRNNLASHPPNYNLCPLSHPITSPSLSLPVSLSLSLSLSLYLSECLIATVMGATVSVLALPC